MSAKAGVSAFSVEIPGVAGTAIVLAAAYYLGVQVGIHFTIAPNAVSLIWPPNAMVLAALLLSPPRHWPWLALAVFPPHFYLQLEAGVPLLMSVCWYVSNLSEALIGASLIRLFLDRSPRFDEVRDATVFLICGVGIAPIVSSFIDAGFVAWAGWRYDDNYWHVFRMRLFSNALATITLVPLVISIGRVNLLSIREAVRTRGLEGAVVLSLLAVTAWFVFHRQYGPGESATYVYAPLPLIVWAAVRLGVGGVASSFAILAFLSISGEMHGVGPFGRADPKDAVLSLQIFLIIAASSLMLLAASLSELQRAKSTALRRKESLDLALSAARMGVWEWDVTTDRFSWRMASQDVPTTMALPALFGVVHVDDQALVSTIMQQARHGEDVNELECRFMRDGKVHWVMVKGKYLRKVRGRSHRLIGVWMDITRTKHREARERSQRDQLAHLSRVAMLGELSGALTHELSQPLASILFNAQAGVRALENRNVDLREITSILNDIVTADTRAAEVIRRLRALFKRGTVQKERMDVRDCVQAALALEHSDLIVRGVTTYVELGSEPLMVNVDPVQMQQVLLNLIVNACEAMHDLPTHERRLRVTVNSEPEHGRIHVAISDSGPGVENPEKIFEPFFTTKRDGIGLGLPISRSIVAAHGGRLWATNDPGGGATLHVALDAVADDENESAARDYQVSAARARS